MSLAFTTHPPGVEGRPPVHALGQALAQNPAQNPARNPTGVTVEAAEQPGWYRDLVDARRHRYWTGAQWLSQEQGTAHPRPRSARPEVGSEVPHMCAGRCAAHQFVENEPAQRSWRRSG